MGTVAKSTGIGTIIGATIGSIIAPGVGTVIGATIGGTTGYVSGESSVQQTKAANAIAQAQETASTNLSNALNRVTITDATSTNRLSDKTRRSILNGLSGSKSGYRYDPSSALSGTTTGKTALGQ